MRTVQTSGLLLIAIGLWLVIRPPSYSHQESVFKLGELEARVQERRQVPGWTGGVALAAGLVLVVVGSKKR